ncbi:winged helix-turn-helix transcriptional regulator [Halosolutus halophilus]|uniref:winged helix-turn-helix transcriptional regulator n=1 Tax=Halosolutus halophilus TaxID=1552990 RepID=UPI002234FB73|nr:helix-turn-helix domain-containing protein [Halosolutus halophilus]
MDESTEQLEVWCAGEDWCPVTSTATLIGKKWHTVVLHRLLANGPLGFNALKTEVGGISSKVLSDVLDDLEGKRLIDREIVNEKPVRVEYSLTAHGESLEPVIQEMAEWGREHLTAAADVESSIA